MALSCSDGKQLEVNLFVSNFRPYHVKPICASYTRAGIGLNPLVRSQFSSILRLPAKKKPTKPENPSQTSVADSSGSISISLAMYETIITPITG